MVTHLTVWLVETENDSVQIVWLAHLDHFLSVCTPVMATRYNIWYSKDFGT